MGILAKRQTEEPPFDMIVGGGCYLKSNVMDRIVTLHGASVVIGMFEYHVQVL